MKAIFEFSVCRQGNPGLFSGLIFFPWMILFFLLSFPSGAQFNPFTKITDDDYPQSSPAIDGDYIVYEDNRSGGVRDIYLYNITTGEEIPLTSDPQVSSIRPDISGDRVVWQDNRNGNWDIYIYDISRPDLGAYPLIDFPDDQILPAIYGDILVFVDHAGNEFSANIFMYNLKTHELTQITDDSEYQQTDPDVYGNYIVYQNVSGHGDIYLYNINTGEKTLLTDGPGDQRHPVICGNRVVWEDNRDGNWNLYMHVIGLMVLYSKQMLLRPMLRCLLLARNHVYLYLLALMSWKMVAY